MTFDPVNYNFSQVKMTSLVSADGGLTSGASGSGAGVNGESQNNEPAFNLPDGQYRVINGVVYQEPPILAIEQALPEEQGENVHGQDAGNVPPERSTRGSSNNYSLNNFDQFHDMIPIGRSLTVSEALKILPEFDGRNMPVAKFARECKDLETLIDLRDKNIYLRMVKSRVTGIASQYLEFKNFNCLDQMLDELRRAFSATTNLSQLQAELSRVTQRSNEGVSQYGLRVTRLLHRMIEKINSTYQNDVARGMIQGVSDGAIKCFISGLSDQLSLLMAYKEPFSLELAINDAKLLESNYLQRVRLFGRGPNRRDLIQPNIDNNAFMNTNDNNNRTARVRTVADNTQPTAIHGLFWLRI